MQKFCQNCGAKVKEGARICHGCGERQEINEEPVTRRRYSAPYKSTSQYVPDEGIREMFFRWDNRLNRKRFFLRHVASFFASIVVTATLGFSLAMMGIDRQTAATNIRVSVLPFAAAGIMLNIRRFHDLNRSGWCVLLMLIPLLNIIVALYLLVCEGTDGENKFGPDPLEADCDDED